MGSEGGRAAWSASSHPAGSGAIPTVRASTCGLASSRAWPGLHPLGFVRSERRRCVVRMTDEPHRQRAESSPGEGSPGAEREVLAGSPAGRTWTITKPPELVASRAGDLTPWSAGGSGFDFAGQFRSQSQLHRCPVEAHGKWLRLRPVRHIWARSWNANPVALSPTDRKITSTRGASVPQSLIKPVVHPLLNSDRPMGSQCISAPSALVNRTITLGPVRASKSS